jgi:catechol 2,3-dioxygenase-like lactoylglutathione lyase family enzyme
VLDHVSLPVSDVERSRRFYEMALSPLGYSLLMQHPISGTGFGRAGKPDFWIREGAGSTAVHVAFSSPDRATVDAFHAAAVAAGGRDNGRPDLRPEYHSTYYGAFILDPDGNNIEAVCHRPERNS